MKLGFRYFDARDRRRYGTFCGLTGEKHRLAVLKRDGKVFYVAARWLKRLDCGGFRGARK